MERVREGLSYHALERLRRKLALSTREFADFIQIPFRTLMRRQKAGRLEPDESDRLLRASRIYWKTLELFEGDEDAARAWLTSEQPGLGGATPLFAARTDVGSREIERLIGRLEHGIPA
jgi:putative toxin-antitoxin system antitoxin component (TIGR02293 family)